MVVVVGGNVLHHVKSEGKMSGRICPKRKMPRGECPDPPRLGTHLHSVILWVCLCLHKNLGQVRLMCHDSCHAMLCYCAVAVCLKHTRPLGLVLKPATSLKNSLYSGIAVFQVILTRITNIETTNTSSPYCVDWPMASNNNTVGMASTHQPTPVPPSSEKASAT